MSEMNGDKARFGRTRKENIRRREGIRELWMKVEGKTPGIVVAESEQEENSTVTLRVVATDRR